MKSLKTFLYYFLLALIVSLMVSGLQMFYRDYQIELFLLAIATAAFVIYRCKK